MTSVKKHLSKSLVLLVFATVLTGFSVTPSFAKDRMCLDLGECTPPTISSNVSGSSQNTDSTFTVGATVVGGTGTKSSGNNNNASAIPDRDPSKTNNNPSSNNANTSSNNNSKPTPTPPPPLFSFKDAFPSGLVTAQQPVTTPTRSWSKIDSGAAIFIRNNSDVSNGPKDDYSPTPVYEGDSTVFAQSPGRTCVGTTQDDSWGQPFPAYGVLWSQQAYTQSSYYREGDVTTETVPDTGILEKVKQFGQSLINRVIRSVQTTQHTITVTTIGPSIFVPEKILRISTTWGSATSGGCIYPPSGDTARYKCADSVGPLEYKGVTGLNAPSMTLHPKEGSYMKPGEGILTISEATWFDNTKKTTVFNRKWGSNLNNDEKLKLLENCKLDRATLTRTTNPATSGQYKVSVTTLIADCQSLIKLPANPRSPNKFKCDSDMNEKIITFKYAKTCKKVVADWPANYDYSIFADNCDGVIDPTPPPTPTPTTVTTNTTLTPPVTRTQVDPRAPVIPDSTNFACVFNGNNTVTSETGQVIISSSPIQIISNAKNWSLLWPRVTVLNRGSMKPNSITNERTATTILRGSQPFNSSISATANTQPVVGNPGLIYSDDTSEGNTVSGWGVPVTIQAYKSGALGTNLQIGQRQWFNAIWLRPIYSWDPETGEQIKVGTFEQEASTYCTTPTMQKFQVLGVKAVPGK